MVTKEQEYTAEVLKIAGFAFIAPFGKLILGIPFFRMHDITIDSILFFIFTFSLCCFGIMLMFKGKELLREYDI